MNIQTNDRPTQEDKHMQLRINSCSITKKRNLKVCFVKDSKVVNSNTLSFDNINLAKRVLVKSLSFLW